MYNIGCRKETRISEIKRNLWCLWKRSGFHGNIKDKTQGMKEKSPALPLAYGQKTESYIHGYQYFSPREWKIIELQTKREGLDIELFTKKQERVLGDTCILIQILQFYLL